MRRILSIIFCLSFFLIQLTDASGDPMSELVQQFGSDYESLIPPPNSSVRTDYKQEQIALGALYTTRAIGLLYQQNKLVIQKYDEMVIKYNEIISQNEEIIRILSIIAQKKNKVE